MKLRNELDRADNTDRDHAILQHIDLVENAAKRFKRRVPPSVTFDDLAGAGMVGLIQAVDRFDASRGLKFNSYAQHRIWGAMQDFLREQDPLSRAERRRLRDCAPATVSLDQVRPSCLAAPLSTAFANRTEFRSALKCLSARENRVITLLYDMGWQAREIAVDLGVNESRVSQIKIGALSKIRLALTLANTARAA